MNLNNTQIKEFDLELVPSLKNLSLASTPLVKFKGQSSKLKYVDLTETFFNSYLDLSQQAPNLESID